MKNIFLTGPPRCGKTTAVIRIAELLAAPLQGFYTAEIRERGERVGFEIRCLDGERAVLSRKGLKSPYRVGRYGVDVVAFEAVAVPVLVPRSTDRVVILDEIGKMECLSGLFRKAVRDLLDSANTVVGTVALTGHPFIVEVRGRPDVKLVEITTGNRERIPERVAGMVNR